MKKTASPQGGPARFREASHGDTPTLWLHIKEPLRLRVAASTRQ